MSRREQILVIVGVVVLMCVGYYFLAVQPKRAEALRLTEQLEAAEKQLDQLKAIAKQADQLEKEYARLQSSIAAIEAKLPSMKEVPTLLVQLERQTKSLKVNLTAFRPGQLEPIAPASEPAGAAAGATPPTAAPAGGRTPAPTSKVAYYRFPIKLTMTASYGQVLQLMSQLRDFPRLMRVRRLTVNPKTVPDLNLDLDVDTFVLPKEGG